MQELSSRVISRQHIQLLVDKTGDVFLVDLNSTHGTIIRRGVESNKVHAKQPVRLLDGDLVTIGRPVVSGSLHDAVRFKIVFRHGTPEKSPKPACPYMAGFFATYKDLPAIDAALHPRPTGAVTNVTGRYGLEPSMLYESEPESVLSCGRIRTPAKGRPEVINVVDDSDNVDSSDSDDLERISDDKGPSPPSSVDAQDDDEVRDPDTTICIPSSIVEYESQDNAEDDDAPESVYSVSNETCPLDASLGKNTPALEAKEEQQENPSEGACENDDVESGGEDNNSSEGPSVQLPSIENPVHLPDLRHPIQLPDFKDPIQLPKLQIQLPFPVPVLDLAGDSVPDTDDAHAWHNDDMTPSGLADADVKMTRYISEPPAAQSSPAKNTDDDEYESWLFSRQSRFSSQEAEDDFFGSDFLQDDDGDGSTGAWDGANDSVASEDEDNDAVDVGDDDESEGGRLSDDDEVGSELSDPQSALSEDGDVRLSYDEEDASEFYDNASEQSHSHYDSDNDDDEHEVALDSESENADDDSDDQEMEGEAVWDNE